MSHAREDLRHRPCNDISYSHATSLFGNAFINESVIPIIQHSLADFMERLGSEAFTFFWQCLSHLGRQPEDKTPP